MRPDGCQAECDGFPIFVTQLTARALLTGGQQARCENQPQMNPDPQVEVEG